MVELLVVIAIIGILIGMLLPAVQQVREAARRTACINKMRQVILACHNYQSRNLKFPPGATQSGDSFAVMILPDLEQQSLADNYRATTKDAIARSTLSSTRLDVLLCPSSVQQDEITTDSAFGEFTSHYLGSAGPADDTNFPTKYSTEVLEANTNIGLDGVFSPYSPVPTDPTVKPVYSIRRGKDFSDMQDGSSNTIAFGEASRSPNANLGFAPQRAGWAWGYDADSTTAGKLGNSYSVNAVFSGTSSIPPSALNGLNTTFNNHSFGSNHSGGSLFALADGSSQYVNELVDVVLLQKVLGMTDGFTVTVEDID